MVVLYTTADGKQYTAADGTLLVLGSPVVILITDRTLQDVNRWKELHDKGWAAMTEEERSEWSGSMKGRYSYTDMNRVEGVVADLSARFVEAGYLDTPLTTKTDWGMWDVPTRSDMTRYLGNIATLRNLVSVYASTPAAPSIDQKFDYERANDIEKILIDVSEILTAIPQSWFYAGDLRSGEV